MPKKTIAHADDCLHKRGICARSSPTALINTDYCTYLKASVVFFKPRQDEIHFPISKNSYFPLFLQSTHWRIIKKIKRDWRKDVMKKAVNVGSALKGRRYLGAAGKRVFIRKTIIERLLFSRLPSSPVSDSLPCCLSERCCAFAEKQSKANPLLAFVCVCACGASYTVTLPPPSQDRKRHAPGALGGVDGSLKILNSSSC